MEWLLQLFSRNNQGPYPSPARENIGSAMTELRNKVQNALDEARMLVLGSQVLLGFEYRSVFESDFESLPVSTRYIKVGALTLMLLVLSLLLSPGPYHQIVERGEDTNRIHRFATMMMEIALLPFALALGVDIYVAVEKFGGRLPGIIAGLTTLFVALFFWYGLEIIARKKHAGETSEKSSNHMSIHSQSETKLNDKVKHVLTEARVVLPGSQALLGFQLATMLMDGFDKLPVSSKYIHFASLVAVTLSVILLMTPAAYHRLVERGENSEHFHRFAGKTLLAAMIPLALGISGDFLVVLRLVSGSFVIAIAAAVAFLVFTYGLWFGVTLYRREKPATPR